MSDIGDTFTLFYEELQFEPKFQGGYEPVYDYTEFVTSHLQGGCCDDEPLQGGCCDDEPLQGGKIASTSPELAIYESGDDSGDELVLSDSDEIEFDEESDDVIEFDESIAPFIRDNIDSDNFVM